LGEVDEENSEWMGTFVSPSSRSGLISVISFGREESLYLKQSLRITLAGGNYEMAKFALYAELKAKPGKEADVEAFLKQGAEMAKAEAGTVHWYGFKEDKGGIFGVFDTFNDEAGRDAHLNGEIAKALMANAETLFSEAPKIHKINLIAEKV
jgi:quinol monooxygenase YgiN